MEGPLPSAEELSRFSLSMDERIFHRRTFAIERVLRLYAILGVVVALVSLAYFGFSFLQIDLTRPQQMSLIVAGSSLGLAGFSYGLLMYRIERATLRIEEFVQRDHFYDVVKQWAVFESAGRDLLTRRGDPFNKHSPRAILSALVSDGLISSADMDQLHLALDVRNRLVHSAEPVAADSIQKASEILRSVNDQLYRAKMPTD